MKILSIRLFKYALLGGLFLYSTISCNKGGDTPPLIDPSDAVNVGKALILPDGTETKEGTPPAPSTNPQAPKVTPVVTEQPTNNGSTETVPIRYSNLNNGIGGVYAQVEGATNYYNIPLSGGGSSTSGTINVPIGIPENFGSGTFILVYCIYDRSGRVSNILRIRFTITRTEPLKSGEGRATVNGRTVKATAVCDLDFGPYGRGYGIQINDNEIIVFYNMRQGNVQLGDLETLIDNSTTGDITAPFAWYFDGSSIYWSVSGSATVSGKKISSSATFREAFGSRTISVTASGNCQ
jgi:hypothetical protein